MSAVGARGVGGFEGVEELVLRAEAREVGEEVAVDDLLERFDVPVGGLGGSR